jgi:hypothetical protein
MNNSYIDIRAKKQRSERVRVLFNSFSKHFFNLLKKNSNLFLNLFSIFFFNLVSNLFSNLCSARGKPGICPEDTWGDARGILKTH